MAALNLNEMGMRHCRGFARDRPALRNNRPPPAAARYNRCRTNSPHAGGGQRADETEMTRSHYITSPLISLFATFATVAIGSAQMLEAELLRSSPREL